jgi:murein DD-endopeptidase MepM/ murein hydrolase activator NlpD
MRVWIGVLVSALVLTACASPETDKPATETAAAQPAPSAATPPAVTPPAPPVPAEPPKPVEPPPVPAPPPAPVIPAVANKLDCPGPATQGGAILCWTEPGATLALDGKAVAVADKEGLAVIGLTRTQASPATIAFAPPKEGALPAERAKVAKVEVLKRTDTVSKLTMECNQISAQSPEEKKKAEDSWIKKDKALKTFAPALASIAFQQPVAGVLTSSFGATRTYEPKNKGECAPTVNVHNGTDIAVPTGTEIRAPMAGTVILADPDLYYEGGCIFLDLGRGLVSVTMHMSRIDVKPGDVVTQGQLLGLSGATGRVTGPHLHWAIKYRNVTDPDRASDIWLDPTLLMKLNSGVQPH